MNDTPAPAADTALTPPNYVRFLGILVLVKLAIVAIFYALTFVGVELKTTSTFVVAPMVAAMIEGQMYAKANGVKPAGALCWRFAILSAILAIFVEVLITAALFALIPQVGQAVGSMPIVYMIAGGMLAFYFAAFIISHRFFFPMGARNYLNAEAAKAKRAASKAGKS
ncbi:MAG: ABZJ_00895 family protein [Paracoccaceae bacterium]